MSRLLSENPVDGPRASGFVTGKDPGGPGLEPDRILRQAPGSRACVIVCFGLFSIVAQTLLFREFMAAFEGHDIGIGCFFGAWFLWIVLGAWVIARVRGLVQRLVHVAELVLLGYIPAFCLQYALLVFFRDLAGIESFAFLKLQHILGGALLVTAPVSLLTGLLFPVLCRWVDAHDPLPVGRVYMLEASGSLLGGLGVTLFYYYGAGTACIFLLLATVICAVVTWSSWTPGSERPNRIKRGLTLICLLLCVAAWTLRVDSKVTQVVQTHKWQQLLPTGTLQGAFLTPQAEYLYGSFQEQWIVMREGSVCETLGDQTEAGRLAAMTLCQNTKAQNILVLGEGLELCRSLLMSRHVTSVDWFHPDPQYIPSLVARVPKAFLPDDKRLHCRSGEVQNWLTDHPEAYDIVLINLPETTNAVFMRFMTREFLARVKQSLGYGGLVALGFTGGENVEGEELIQMGASLRATLATQFAQTVLVPGELSCFLSSNLPYLNDAPTVLQRRFQTLENARAIYPPEGLSTLYRPQRASEVLEAYDQVDWPKAQMINTVTRPHHYRHQLLFLSKQSGLSLLGSVQTVMRSGPGLLLIPLILLALIRFLYVTRTVTQGQGSRCDVLASVRLDVMLMVACTGLVGIGTVIVLMHVFQMHYGSLYLHVGLISALFMVGLTLGAFGVKRGLSYVDAQSARGPNSILVLGLILIVFHSAGLATMGACIDHHLPPWGFALLLLLGGLCCGGYVPLGARILQFAHAETETAASHLEGADHLGAALGGCLASLVLLPLFGPQTALCAMAIVIFANTVLLGTLYCQCRGSGQRVHAHPVLTPLGYTLSALAVCVVVGSYMLSQARASSATTEDAPYAQAWVEGRRIMEKTATLGPSAADRSYCEIHEGPRLKGYVFDSALWTDPVYGYGGPMSLVAFVEPNGVLIDFRVTLSQETPGYLQWLEGWMQSMRGSNVFGPEPLKGVDSVSGATLSSQAIMALLSHAGQGFARTVLAQETALEQGRPVKIWDWPLIGLALGLVLALAAIYHGRLWSRVLVLVYVAVVSGFWLNRQYTLDQVMRLLQGQGLLTVPLASLCLLLGVPLLCLLCGNVYCGYLCPFGALQELLALLIPKRFKPRLCLSAVTWSRFIKYVLLFVLILAFFGKGQAKVPGLDPLMSFFNLRFWLQGIVQSTGFAIALIALAGGLFVTRLWCRYLCPTGAFLSLFNLGAGLKRLFPGKKWGRCEFGLSVHDKLDCICCDRCLYTDALVPLRAEVVTQAVPRWGSGLFVIVLIGLALALAAPAWYADADDVSAATGVGPVIPALQGESRDVDAKQIEQLIQQGKLSDQEALFYRQGPKDPNLP